MKCHLFILELRVYVNKITNLQMVYYFIYFIILQCLAQVKKKSQKLIWIKKQINWPLPNFFTTMDSFYL
jgi:hypothetical protein